MYLNEILPGNWREDEWPEHIEVSHESSRFKSRRYVPRVNSANKSSANPVDGIWCSHCGWAGVIAQDMTDLDEVDDNLIQSILWYAIAAIWALIAIARWLSGEPEGSDAMTHFGIAFILANIFELRSEMGKIGEK